MFSKIRVFQWVFPWSIDFRNIFSLEVSFKVWICYSLILAWLNSNPKIYISGCLPWKWRLGPNPYKLYYRRDSLTFRKWHSYIGEVFYNSSKSCYAWRWETSQVSRRVKKSWIRLKGLAGLYNISGKDLSAKGQKR